MGVTGLWRLVEPAGKPVPVETLENKVLAVDISIWLHQMVKGYQDAKGAPVANAHLMGLFQRLCKLLYFRIKPVFVFDGAFPELKKETIAKRQDHKAKYNSESERIKRELALLLSKKTAVNSLLGKQISPKKSGLTSADPDDLFKLPALPQREEESESESDDEQNTSSSSVDLHTVDLESDSFKKLDVKEKYDLLIELKETRKQSSWGRLKELPKKSDTFSDFQMQRLLKRRKVQECIEETEKEMGDSGMSLNELESLLNEEGIDTRIDTIPTRRIASNVSTRFLLIKDVKQALSEARKRKELENEASTSKIQEITETKEEKLMKVDELEDDLQKAIKMSLECVDEPSKTHASDVTKTDDSWTSCMTDTDYSSTDSEEDDGFEEPDMSCAKAYIMQYSDFTHRAIDKIVNDRNKHKVKQIKPKVDEILEEINNENSVIVDNVELSSSDEDCVQEDSSAFISSEANKQIATEPNSLPDDQEALDNNFDATQSSVVCIENPTQEIISLDSSTEEVDLTEKEFSKPQIKEENVSNYDFTLEKISNMESKDETDSSESDFEEVPELETKSNKPVVELTLNMGDEPEDDIFADIFEVNKDKLEIVADKKVEIKNVKTDHEQSSKEVEIIFKVPEVPAPKANALFKTSNIVNKVDNLDILSEQQSVHQNNRNVEDVVSTLSSNTNQEKPKDYEDPKVKPSENKDEIEENNIVSIPTVKDRNEQPSELAKISNSTSTPAKEILTTEKLNSLVTEMESAEQDLIQEKGRLDRVGRNITEQMTKEAQELLQIFGIPYIVAPMEAEAQCAFLESVKLTDGTITDDSDIWLFGGRTVYKNFFNQKKHVLQFLAERIEKSFNLSREQLVLLALLVGSDYTTGVTGVGPVTAMEILASFPFNKRQLNEASKQEKYAAIVKGLQEFKQWVRAGKRTDNTSLKKKLKNVDLTDDFPSVRVVQAYLEPNIEKSEEKFSWGELDITILRDYTKAKFGWNQHKLDEIIKPVLKRIQDRKTQRTVHDFFKRKVDFQSLEEQMSKRVKAAVQRMGPELPIAEANESEETTPALKRKATKTKSTNKAGPSAAKQRKKNEDIVLMNQGVKVVSHVKDGKSEFEIQIPKSDRCQEIIPQREKDKQSLLENKMKAIELFRKTKLDQKRKPVKRKALQPKEKAELSESDSD